MLTTERATAPGKIAMKRKVADGTWRPSRRWKCRQYRSDRKLQGVSRRRIVLGLRRIAARGYRTKQGSGPDEIPLYEDEGVGASGN